MHTNNTAEVIDNCTDLATQETLVVLLATGGDDGGMRATLAFTAATCAAAMDKRTVVFMVGDGAHWAYEGRTAGVLQKGFPPLQELMDCLVEMGGEMYVCSTCDGVCSVPSDDLADDVKRHPAIQPLGMSAVLADIHDGRAVSF
jgi:predicted peroxiredoxin